MDGLEVPPFAAMSGPEMYTELMFVLGLVQSGGLGSAEQMWRVLMHRLAPEGYMETHRGQTGPIFALELMFTHNSVCEYDTCGVSCNIPICTWDRFSAVTVHCLHSRTLQQPNASRGSHS